MTLTVIILTYNEARHIERAIQSVRGIADSVVVVDSGSQDETLAIAQNLGAETLSNPWKNHATQFNWALDNLSQRADWVLRLDADEVLSADLAHQIAATLPGLGPEISGVTMGRRMAFLGRPIRHGGLFPIRVLRLFRPDKGRCENRWMDEHITVDGKTHDLPGEMLDDNLNSLTWWTEKHNAYASLEALEMLNLEHGFLHREGDASLCQKQAGAKRWIKERVYSKMPAGLRALVYFLYRYGLRAGFLDGREGLAFHVLQGFWYRFLVDAKLAETRAYMTRTGCDPPTAIQAVLGIDVS